MHEDGQGGYEDDAEDDARSSKEALWEARGHRCHAVPLLVLSSGRWPDHLRLRLMLR